MEVAVANNVNSQSKEGNLGIAIAQAHNRRLCIVKPNSLKLEASQLSPRV